jgi:hypothetical protein
MFVDFLPSAKLLKTQTIFEKPTTYENINYNSNFIINWYA